jgi:hypothetical protein
MHSECVFDLRTPIICCRIYSPTFTPDLGTVPWYYTFLIRVINWMIFLTEPRCAYLVVYVLFTWLGRTISPFFFAFHLMDIVFQFETLKAVIQSVTRNGKQLLLTVALVLVVVYYYAVVAFSFLRDNAQYGVRAFVAECAVCSFWWLGALARVFLCRRRTLSMCVTRCRRALCTF